MSMLNVPHQLLQPLSVDTNISYDLDMSKFPGLDDPHQMYEPALLITTDWSQYVYSDENNVIDNGQNIPSATTDTDTDWLNDLEAVLPDVISTHVLDPDAFQSLIDDVIEDPVILNELDILGINSDLSEISHEKVQDSSEGITDSSSSSHMISNDMISYDVRVFSESSNGVVKVHTKGQKRQRTWDKELYITPKKYKREYTTYSKLPGCVSGQTDSNECVHSCRRS